jgi:hypothetical protein
LGGIWYRWGFISIVVRVRVVICDWNRARRVREEVGGKATRGWLGRGVFPFNAPTLSIRTI